MSNMIKIINELQGNENDSAKRWIKVKDGWNNYQHCTNKEDLINKISTIVEPNKTRVKRKTLKALCKNTIVSIVKDPCIPKFKSPEEGIERILCYLNEKIFNQLCVGKNNKESIDLIYSPDGQIKEELIEFKTTSNTPTYAFIELIKNYCLIKKTVPDEIKETKKLILLAPRSYFLKFKNNNSIKEFFKTINYFNDNAHVDFEIYYLDIDNNLFDTFIKLMAEEDYYNWVNSNVETYKFVKHLELSRFKNEINTVKNKLLKENWVNLTENEWLNL